MSQYNDIVDFLIEASRYLIKWGPTVLFVVLVLFGCLIGMFRGFRKSLIMFIHAIVAFIVCAIIYLIIVNLESTDKFLLDLINIPLGENGLQRMLNVSTTCSGIKEVFLEYIIYNGNYGDVISIALKDNGAYIATLVDMAYRIVAALALSVLYFILIFIMYIIYFIFYPERRYIKKRKKAFIESKSDRSYKKQKRYGVLIGGFRGLVSAVILLSFIGSMFYITAGGKGEGSVSDVSFNNEAIDLTYDSYRAIESYGAQGIYKVFNSLDDKNETPYYLFAADFILQGKLNDPEKNINENVVFRSELSSYTKFARESFNLVMKYGGDEIKDVILNSENKNVMDVIMNIMQKPEFQDEFKLLIYKFESTTYITNLTLSLLESIINNIDNIKFSEGINKDTIEIIKILFKEGYLSNQIPEEMDLLDQISSGANINSNIYNKPVIKLSHLIKKEDVIRLYDIAMICLSLNEESTTEDVLKVIKEIIPSLEKLSILSSERKSEFNPILGRLYSFVEAKYLETSTYSYEYIKDSNIDWIYELKVIVSTSLELLELYENIYVENKEVLDILLDMFNPETNNYYTNVAIYDRLLYNISQSKLLGRVLSTNKVFKLLKEQLSGVVQGLYFENNIIFENTYDSYGNVIYGELYQLLSAIKILGSPENRVIIDSIRNNENTKTTELLNKISDAMFNRDENNKALVDYLLDSKIFTSLFSAYIIQNKQLSSDYSIYVPSVVLKTDSNNNVINIIQEDVLRDLFYKLPSAIELINPILDDPNNNDKIVALLENDTLYDMLNNKIIEGTISGIVKSYLKNSKDIVISKNLDSIDNWITIDSNPGELNILISLIKDNKLDINVLMNPKSSTDLFKEIKKVIDSNPEKLLESEIVYYTISNYILNKNIDEFEIIVPYSSRVMLINDSIPYLINKIELNDLLSKIDLFISNDNQFNTLIKNFIVNRKILITNKIALASFVNYIVNNEEFNNNVKDALIIPDDYKQSGTKNNLLNLNTTNVWNNEAPMLLQAIDELFEISTREDEFSFDNQTLTNEMNNVIASLNTTSSIDQTRTKLEVSYESMIIVASISKRIDDGFKDLVSENVRALVKINGVYTYNEISALVNIINIYDIDINNSENVNAIEDKIINEFLTYNNPREEEEFNGRSTIEIISDSIIIRRVLSDNIDNEISNKVYSIRDLEIAKDLYGAYTYNELSSLISALAVFDVTSIKDEIKVDEKIFSLTSDDVIILYQSYIVIYIINKSLDEIILGIEADLSDNLAYEETLNSNLIKTNEGLNVRKYYLEEEINDLLKLLEELDIKSADDLKNYNFKECIKTLNNASNTNVALTRLDVLYESYIFGAIVTKKILDETKKEDAKIMNHPFAYLEQANIYRKNELEAFSKLLDGKDIDNFDINSVTLDDIDDYIYDSEGTTKSYLMVSTISFNIFKNAEVIVPNSELDKHVKDETIISPKAVRELIEACKCLGLSNANFNMDDIIAPTRDNEIEIVLASEIARASITFNIVLEKERNGDYVYTYVYEEDAVKATNHIGNTIIILTESALKKIFKAVNIINDGKFTIYIDIYEIIELYNTDPSLVIAALESSIISLAVSDALIAIDSTETLKYLLETMTVYELSIPNRTFTKDALTNEKIIEVLNSI